MRAVIEGMIEVTPWGARVQLIAEVEQEPACGQGIHRNPAALMPIHRFMLLCLNIPSGYCGDEGV
jgi:hypothetical protein